MDKTKKVTYDEVAKFCKTYIDFSTEPTEYPKLYRDDHIFDENKSIKWNHEEVERMNENHNKEIQKLIEEKKQLKTEYDKMVYRYIITNSKITEKNKAEELWGYIEDEYCDHSNMGQLYALNKLLKVLNFIF